MSHIDDLIQRAKALNANPIPGTKKPAKYVRSQPKIKPSQDIYIWQDRPVTYHNWQVERDIVFVNVYNVSHLPIDLSSFSVVLHGHSLYEPCVRSQYCHRMGYKVRPEQLHYNEFYKKWGFLYGVTIEQKGIDLSL